MADDKQKQDDDKGTVGLGMIVGLASIGSRFLPGKGGEQHLKNAFWELGKFFDARADALDSYLDTDG